MVQEIVEIQAPQRCHGGHQCQRSEWRVRHPENGQNGSADGPMPSVIRSSVYTHLPHIYRAERLREQDREAAGREVARAEGLGEQDREAALERERIRREDMRLCEEREDRRETAQHNMFAMLPRNLSSTITWCVIDCVLCIIYVSIQNCKVTVRILLILKVVFNLTNACGTYTKII